MRDEDATDRPGEREPDEPAPARPDPGPRGSGEPHGEREPGPKEPPTAAPPGGGGQGGSPPAAAAPGPRRLLRSRTDRVIGGVCGGLGRHFDVDPVVFRIGLAALAFFGGAGVVLYLVALVLVPSEPGPVETAAPARNRVVTLLGTALLGLAAIALLAPIGAGLFGLVAFPFVPFLGPLAVLAVVGLLLYAWLRDRDQDGDLGRILGRVALAAALLAAAVVGFLASFWAAASGSGVVVAGLVILIGALLVAAAFRGRRARWLAVPAFVLAVPLGIVAAADVDLDGGVGERRHRPASAAQLQDTYRLGAGRLELDLLDVDFPPGERRVNLQLGMGEAFVVVPEDVCVVTEGRIGMGYAGPRGDGGLELDWRDGAPAAAAAPRLRLNADIGMGELTVVNERPPERLHRRGFRRGWDGDEDEDRYPLSQAACARSAPDRRARRDDRGDA